MTTKTRSEANSKDSRVNGTGAPGSPGIYDDMRVMMGQIRPDSRRFRPWLIYQAHRFLLRNTQGANMKIRVVLQDKIANYVPTLNFEKSGSEFN